MYHRPFARQVESALGQFPFDNCHRSDLDCGFVFTIASVKVRRRVVVVEHADQDAVKGTNSGHAVPLQSPKNLPICLKPFTLSHTAFNPAVNGIARINPGASHRYPHSISEKVTTSGFKC